MPNYSGDAKSLAELARDQCEAIADCIDTGDLQGAMGYLNSALNNLTALRIDLEEMRKCAT